MLVTHFVNLGWSPIRMTKESGRRLKAKGEGEMENGHYGSQQRKQSKPSVESRKHHCELIHIGQP
jgi:hypothetical protein